MPDVSRDGCSGLLQGDVEVDKWIGANRGPNGMPDLRERRTLCKERSGTARACNGAKVAAASRPAMTGSRADSSDSSV